MIGLDKPARYLATIPILALVGLTSRVIWPNYFSRQPARQSLNEIAHFSNLTAHAVPVSTSPSSQREAQTLARTAYGKMPLSFETNHGQTDPRVRFLSRGPGFSLFLTASDAVLVMRTLDARSRAVMRMALAGANPSPQMIATGSLPGKSNYLLGNDPQQWHTNISHHAKVTYQAVYPGIDLVYYGTERRLEYDFVVTPGADPGLIKVRFAGTRDARIDTNGDLVLRLADREIRQRKPVVYQEVAGIRHETAGRYVVNGNDEIGFQIASYDRSRPLVIDPVLVFSSYLGGSFDEICNGIAVDTAGQAYVTGETISPDFPGTPGVLQPGQPRPHVVFITKLNPSGSELVYTTFIGGSGLDQVKGIAVDGAGQAYVTRKTYSRDFPTTPRAFQPDLASSSGNAFVSKLDPSGSAFGYSTYLGGSGPGGDGGNAIAVDGAGHAYVTGYSFSRDFPTTLGAFQPANTGRYDDAFVTKLNPRGSALVYSTFLGGGVSDASYGIAVDGAGHAFVIGITFSTDFPTTVGAYQRTNAGNDDAFVTKLNRRGSALVYSTYLGGSDFDGGRAIAVDSAGRAYVTGFTNLDFPTTRDAFQPVSAGTGDAFVAKFNRRGSALAYSTYLGGGDLDQGTSIGVDGAGQAYVTGYTFSSNFPTTSDAVQPGFAGGLDAFVTKLNRRGSALVTSTYLGGAGGDQTTGIAVDAAGDAYVTGHTSSRNFPVTPGVFQPAYGGGLIDGFVAKIGTAEGDDEEDDDDVDN